MAEICDFCLPHLHPTPPLAGVFHQNIAITFGMEKLEWCGYPMMKKIEDMFFFLTEYTNVMIRVSTHHVTA